MVLDMENQVQYTTSQQQCFEHFSFSMYHSVMKANKNTNVICENFSMRSALQLECVGHVMSVSFVESRIRSRKKKLETTDNRTTEHLRYFGKKKVY